MLENFDPYQFALMMIALIICISIHEFAHAYSAWKAGDETPKAQGRISLNPLDHLDPIGTFMMFASSLSGFGLGWGKPVQVNPLNFDHPRWDNLKVSLWGPLSNILTAVVTGLIIRLLFATGAHWVKPEWAEQFANVTTFLFMLTNISLGLAFFNLIPIAPLDGSHILSALLPYEKARQYDLFMMRHGFSILLGLIMVVPMLFHVNVLCMLTSPPRDLLFWLLTGIH